MANSTQTVEAVFKLSALALSVERLEMHAIEYRRLASEANKLSTFMASEENRTVIPVTTFAHPDYRENVEHRA